MDIISFLDYYDGAITAVATTILAIITIWYAISTYRILEETQVSRKLNDIEYQLANVYLPIEKAIEDYPKSYLENDMNNMDRHHLETALREIKSKNLGVFDLQVMDFSTTFFSSPSQTTLKNFLSAVNIKTNALKNERDRFIQDGKESNITLTNGNIIVEGTGKREKEIEKRERLVQIFLTIGGFFVLYSGSDSDPSRLNVMAPLFIFFLFNIILYYIFITRTKNTNAIDTYAILSSLLYSIFIVTFVRLRSSNALSPLDPIIFIFILTLIFTFSLLSPENSDNIINYVEGIKKKHPLLMKIIAPLMAILALGWFFLSYGGSIYNMAS